jgi:hypothetical protein
LAAPARGSRRWRNEFLEWDLVDGSIGISQPLVPVRDAADRTLCRLILAAPNATQRVTGRGKAVGYVAALAIGAVHQDEPEVRVRGVQGYGARNPVRVVVRMSDDESQAQSSGHCLILLDRRAASFRDAA